MSGGDWAPWAPRVGSAQSSQVDWVVPEWVESVVPTCILLTVEVWSSFDDMTLRSAIDKEGRNLLPQIDSIAERMLRDVMAHDIRNWLEHVWKATPDMQLIDARNLRIWQWSRGSGLTPLGPHIDFVLED